MNSGIEVSKLRSFGALYIAEHRLRSMWKWRGIITAVAIGNPLFYLISIGVGVGVLVSQNSGTSGTGGVEYLVFLVPALLATTSITGAMDEVLFPTIDGFKWRKTFFAMNATPITGPQIALGLFLAAMVRVTYAVVLYWALLVAFGVMTLSDSWRVIPLMIFAGAAFGSFMLGITAGVKNDDYYFAVLGRLVIAPLFLFSGTFFPLTTMPIFLQPIGWVSPLWHATELGRHFSYGYPISTDVIVLHFAYLISLTVIGFLLTRKRFTARLLT